MFNLNQQWDPPSAAHHVTQWLTRERHHMLGKSCTNCTGARYCGKIVTGIQGGKLSTAKKIQFLQAPVASFDCELLSFSTVKVRLMAPLNRIACLFLSLQFSEHWSLWFSNISASIHYNLYFNSPIHTCLCIPSDGFTYCTYPHALGQLLHTIIKLMTISKENNRQFLVGMCAMLETDQSDIC